MAQTHQAGNPTVTAEDPITGLLAAPLGPDWTIEALAEQLLRTIASRPEEDSTTLLLDAAAATDRQSQRILRPLLACLATKSAAEGGTSERLRRTALLRTGPEGPVWISGEFENMPGSVRVVFQRSSSPPRVPEQGNGEPAVSVGTNSQTGGTPGTSTKVCTPAPRSRGERVGTAPAPVGRRRPGPARLDPAGVPADPDPRGGGGPGGRKNQEPGLTPAINRVIAVSRRIRHPLRLRSPQRPLRQVSN